MYAEEVYMENRILILGYDYNADQWKGNNDIEFVNCYKSSSLYVRIFRRCAMTVPFALNHQAIKSILTYKVLVIPDTIATNAFIEWVVRKGRKDQRRIILYRNKLSSVTSFSHNLATRLGYELWSYNKEDCNEYGLYYYHQFINKDRYVFNDDNIIYDAAFVGARKDRADIIIKIKKELDAVGLKTWFFIPGADDIPGNKAIENKEISYDEYLNVLSRSKAVVDIVGQSNYGLTLRPIEALYLRKKLITNYTGIEHEDFYCPENIFIYGRDQDIASFINSAYKDVKNSVKEQYDRDYLIDQILHRK